MITVTISGKSGSGKTTVAQLLARTLEQHGLDVIMVNEDDSPAGLDLVRVDLNAQALKKKKTVVEIRQECQGVSTLDRSTFASLTEQCNETEGDKPHMSVGGATPGE